jgi:ankyrin repeat protein
MRILLEIDEEYQQDAIKILQWIAFCARPLQLREVAEVIAIDSNFYFSHDRRLPEPLDLQIICSCLVIVTQAEVESLGVVERVDELRLAHFSVKEYLVSSRLESSPAKKFSILEMPAHSFIADSCLSYLLHVTDVPSLLEENLWEYPLARYAARYWTHHMLARGGAERTCYQRDLSMELLAVERNRFDNWIRLWNPDEPHARSNLGMQSSEIASPIYYAALCGLHSLVCRLLDMKTDANDLGGLYSTPLQAAAVNGSLPTVQILLSGGAKTEIDAGHYGSPLSAASHKGHQQIVKLLLESGSDSESRDRSGRTALTWAAEGGSLDVVELLVDGGSNIEARDTRLRTPVIWAAESGHVHIVEFFISRGAQIEAKDHHSQAPLIWASKRGHEEVVRLFIEGHADINSKDDRDHTALLWAAKRGYEAVVKLLVECGALIDEQDSNGQTALWWARKRNHQIVVDLLIQLGARSKEGWWGETVEVWRPFMVDNPAYVSLLAEVSTKSYAPLVRYLVEISGNIEARGRKDQTALLWAADEGEEAVVKWITEAEISVDIEARDSSGQTALLCAAKRGYLTIVAALISKGANPEARDSWWLQTPLSWAAKRGHLAIARLLLAGWLTIIR